MSSIVVHGGDMALQILVDQLTLSQPRGADYANQMILASPDFQTFICFFLKQMRQTMEMYQTRKIRRLRHIFWEWT